MSQWYVSPTGSDSNTGLTDNATTGAFATFAHLIAGNHLQANDEIFLYDAAYTVSDTGRLIVPGYGGSSYPGEVSNGIGRDISGVQVHGRGARFFFALNALDQDASQIIAVAPSGWLVEDVTAVQTGDLSTDIEYFTIYLGYSATVKNCTIVGSTALAFGNDNATDHLGANYSKSGPIFVKNCSITAHVAACDMGGQTAPMTWEDTPIDILESAGFSIGFVLSDGVNTFRRCPIKNIGALGNSAQTAGLIFVCSSGSGLVVEKSPILLRGRTAQTYCRVIGYGGHTYGDVSFKDSIVVAPEDCESNVVFGSFTATNTPFYTNPYGSNGPRKTWSNSLKPKWHVPRGVGF